MRLILEVDWYTHSIIVVFLLTVGSADSLQDAVVPIVDMAECNEAHFDKVDGSMFCAGVFNGGTDICQVSSIVNTTWVRFLSIAYGHVRTVATNNR